MPEFLPSESDEAVFGKQSKNPLFETVDDIIEEPIMTDQDWKNMLKCEKDEDSLYDMSDEAANKAAAKKGLIVVYPKNNQIQIDIDSHEAYTEFQRRLEKLFDGQDSTLSIHHTQEFESSSGLPNRHIYITFKGDKKFTAIERIWLQSVLGSDPMRELLDSKRLLMEMTDRPTRLFEHPSVVPAIQ